KNCTGKCMLFQYLQGLQRFSYPHKLMKSQNYWYYSRRFESIVKISAWQENFVGAAVYCTDLL
ncbi:MAG: hypothetical protein MSA84_05120, partial [Lachnospiraceae bacterium]|nr:hypothetical protein [Lachnospiraceae bacterium]